MIFPPYIPLKGFLKIETHEVETLGEFLHLKVPFLQMD